MAAESVSFGIRVAPVPEGNDLVLVPPAGAVAAECGSQPEVADLHRVEGLGGYTRRMHGCPIISVFTEMVEGHSQLNGRRQLGVAT